MRTTAQRARPLEASGETFSQQPCRARALEGVGRPSPAHCLDARRVAHVVPVLRDGILRGTRRLVGPFATHSAAASAKASIVAIPALCASRPTGFGTRKVGNKEKGDCLAISKLESGYQRQRAKPVKPSMPPCLMCGRCTCMYVCKLVRGHPEGACAPAIEVFGRPAVWAAAQAR